jgi:hypothetical protein
MHNSHNKKSYLLRKSEQLRQWDRVLENLIVRAQKANESQKSFQMNQIEKIKAKKVSIENQLKKIEASGEEQWEIDKAGFEKSWKELRNAFSDTTTSPQA